MIIWKITMPAQNIRSINILEQWFWSVFCVHYQGQGILQVDNGLSEAPSITVLSYGVTGIFQWQWLVAWCAACPSSGAHRTCAWCSPQLKGPSETGAPKSNFRTSFSTWSAENPSFLDRAELKTQALGGLMWMCSNNCQENSGLQECWLAGSTFTWHECGINKTDRKNVEAAWTRLYWARWIRTMPFRRRKWACNKKRTSK